jgi:hypothetical protein
MSQEVVAPSAFKAALRTLAGNLEGRDLVPQVSNTSKRSLAWKSVPKTSIISQVLPLMQVLS